MPVSPVAAPRAIYSTRQVREFDRIAIDGFGIAGFDLMQRAARAALRFLQAKWPDARELLIYCGAGNNAGDGYALAALAVADGLKARVSAVVDPDSLSEDAARAVALAVGAGVPIERFPPRAGAPDLVVDALLGTGLTRDVEGDLARAVAQVNAADCPVLALDVPTGLDSDTGGIRGVGVRADATITFVGLKTGLYLGVAPDYRGEIGFSDLGLPADVYADATPAMRRTTAIDVADLLRPRSRISHKGMNGNVLIVGGGPGMGGAARLAAEASLRVGAGLVRVLVAPENVVPVMAGRPEIMCRAAGSAAEIAAACAAASVVVLGPGLGQTPWAEQLAETVLATATPLVVDADGLNFLARHSRQREQWVLTPHPGEAARLLGWSTGDVQARRDVAAAALAERFGAHAVLKGACSIVAQADDNNSVTLSVCDRGNPGMATAGMGDVLAGVTGGLLAQFGLSAQSVAAAVWLHAAAGDDAAAAGERGLIASDLFAHLRRRVNPA